MNSMLKALLRPLWRRLHARPSADRVDFRADFTALGMAVRNKNLDFMDDPAFAQTWAEIRSINDQLWPKGRTPDVRWRAHIAVCKAEQGLHVPGDFVECGTNTGILARFICDHLDLPGHGKRFHLFDTFAGLPTEGLTQTEVEEAQRINEKLYSYDAYAVASESLRDHPEVRLVRGVLPGSLEGALPDRIAFLSMDLNAAAAEIACIDQLWPRLSPGAFVLLDDYGHKHHRAQYDAWNSWASGVGVRICTLPTGQGWFLKAPAPGAASSPPRSA